MSYNFVSAALCAPQDSSVIIYVKYGKFPNEFRIIEQTPHFMHLQLPDRELFISNDADMSSGVRVFDWDECVPISPFHKTSNTFDTAKVIMTNYVEHYGRMDKAAKSCQKGGLPNKTKVMCDSGGFQIMTGRVDYIDPANLAHFYNENCDWGIILDIPLYVGVEEKILLKAAKTQKKNTKKILDNLDGSVELINVCHGFTFDNYDKYLEIVTVPEIDRLCIGGLYMQDLLSSIYSFIKVVSKWKNYYKHFHILGVYNIAALTSFIYLAEKVFPEVLITSDASTPLQSARSGLYHFQREFNRPMERLTIGNRKNNLEFFNPQRLLTCQCPVCRAIKYMDVFSFILNNPLIRALTFHNGFEVNRALMGVATLARSTTFQQYRDIMTQVLKTHVNKESAKKGLDFIEIYLSQGIDKAEQYFQTQNYKGIFDEVSNFSFGEQGELVEEIGQYTAGEFKARVKKCIQIYNETGHVETFKLNKTNKFTKVEIDGVEDDE